MHTRAWDAYEAESQKFFDTYEGLSFETIHGDLIPYLPALGGRCLDVGSGSGRDAAALASRGYHVTAVEPSKSLRALAAHAHASAAGPKIEWLGASLPHLDLLLTTNRKYDFILVSAVWMHVDPQDRDVAFQSLRSLLAQGGYLAISLRLGTPAPERIMHAIDAAQFLDQARAHGLAPAHIGNIETDALKRNSVVWQKIVLQHNAG